MDALERLLTRDGLPPPCEEPEPVAEALASAAGARVHAASAAACSGVVYFLCEGPRLGLAWRGDTSAADAFQGDARSAEVGELSFRLKLCLCSSANAKALREQLAFTAPELIGDGAAIGMGDRLGLATPGHIRAVRGSGVRAVLAQQSIREMSRTGRSPQEVLDDVTWAVLREGFREGYGADADHLKSEQDVDACVAAGYTMFTVDPGAFVDDEAGTVSAETAAEKFDALPWDALESSPADCRSAYAGTTAPIATDRPSVISEDDLHRAAAKYGAAVARTASLYRDLAAAKGDEPFEFEVSVDETATPTSPLEHFYIASELRRLGVAWTSLAPRFVGEFEKGVDFKGDQAAFQRSFKDHAAVARQLGPYKLSVHSGSDKFSIYPIAARLAGGLLHVKTAGTSYVEALRAVATVAPDLFREILEFACEHYEEDRATYHVSAEVENVPSGDVSEDALPRLLDDPNARQVLHVTYGSVLNATTENGAPRFRSRLLDALQEHEDVHLDIIERHLWQHIDPLTKG